MITGTAPPLAGPAAANMTVVGLLTHPIIVKPMSQAGNSRLSVFRIICVSDADQGSAICGITSAQLPPAQHPQGKPDGDRGRP
jgi:hypothetical protein